MEEGLFGTEEAVNEYGDEVKALARYIPWLESKKGIDVMSRYQNGMESVSSSVIAFPVYDSTLMSFVKEVQKTKFMNRNYSYVYSRNQIRSVEDEHKAIAAADVRKIDVLGGILSKYILGGMTKGNLWSDAVKSGIYLEILLKLKVVMEFWDKPLA